MMKFIIFSKAQVGRWKVWRWWKQTVGCTTVSHGVGSWLYWRWTSGCVPFVDIKPLTTLLYCMHLKIWAKC